MSDGVAGFSAPPVVRLGGDSGLSRELLGNKAHGIEVMRAHGMPVPPAFCITTEVCGRFLADPDHTLDAVWDQVVTAMGWLERETGRSFGRGPRPLLVSVRSGAAVSTPGMLDTVLNLGITGAVHDALTAAFTANFADDTRRRFCEMYRRIVLADDDGVAVPDDAYGQLRGAIEAVFRSWNSSRALTYRRHHNLDDVGGTAVVVQAMVFGNLGALSGTGVLFSRNPISGADEPFGEWLPGGQGDEVVSGSTDCEPVTALRDEQPAVYQQVLAAARKLEQLGRDAQDIEFTVEEGRLWLLQTRTAKRSAQAEVRLALRFRAEGLIDDAEVLRRVTPAHIETLLLPSLRPATRAAAPLLARGLPACPGVAWGRAYTDVEAAIDAAEGGEDVILVRPSTSPEDVAGMLAARGVVTEVGGVTSHAAVVSREIGRPAVVGCGAGAAAAVAGKLVTVDGVAGEVREGVLELAAWSERDSPDLTELADIARAVSPLRAHHDGPYVRLDNVSPSAVRAALAAGHTDVVSVTPLIAMLTALHNVGHPSENSP
ncbi:pyruvate, phosphate dikinase [Mycobacterium heidelbergense]|uniref:pyruvate, phosphate dikinase n=1 Tax=Mycobacterium heidelbergense TaxID=53376 RepID=UPI00138B5616|nr:pyruvate, phosphate dikinase [Mycobacterium heidelbergense]